jgi:hypothetical protein
MSEHKVEVVRVQIEVHPNADALELARVGDYLSIVRKGQYKTGDLVAYIPEQSIVPIDLIKEMGLEGRLAGPAHDRVKAVRLRGVLSQGLCYTARSHWTAGQNVAEELGIIKYIPPVPAHLSGEVYAAGQDKCLKYDIENFKRYPEILQDGEPVVFTEKIHGTWCMVGVLPSIMAHVKYGDVIVSSKGMSAQGLALKLHEPEPGRKPDEVLTEEHFDPNGRNLYVRAARANKVVEKVRENCGYYLDQGWPVYVLGEVFGRGVQDLPYGASTGQDEAIGFRVFDIFVGRPGSPEAHYLDDAALDSVLELMALPRVPVLYRGPFSKDILAKWTDGKESVSGNQMHIREGVVVRPVKERRCNEIGRVQLKSVSADYLLRKDGTEYN